MQDHRPASKAPPSTNSEARSLQRPAAIACCFLVLFILYGSLFPFAFHHSTDSDGPVRFLLGTWRDWDRPADLLSNVLLYTPLGFTVFMALPARRPRISPWIVAVLAGSALSVCVELTQYYDVGRVTSMGDVYANTIGSAIGATAAWVAGASAGLPLARELGEHRPEALILVLFLAYQLYPYVPDPTRQHVGRALRGLWEHPVPGPGDLVRFGIIWLLIAALIDRIYGPWRWTLLFPALALAEFAGRVTVVGSSPEVADIAGAVLAFVVWSGGLRRAPRRNLILTAMFAALIAALRLQPFDFSATSDSAFGWIPFLSLMNGSVSVAIQAMFEKSYQYGGLIWLLTRIGLALPASTTLSAALLFCTSVAEVYLPGRSAEITDAVIALVMGGVFALTQDTSARTAHPHG